MQCYSQQRVVFVALQTLALVIGVITILQVFDAQAAVSLDVSDQGLEEIHSVSDAESRGGGDPSQVAVREGASPTSTAQTVYRVVPENEGKEGQCDTGGGIRFMALLPIAFVWGGVLNSEVFLRSAALAL